MNDIEHLKKFLSDTQIGRREFLSAAVALGMSTAAPGLLLAGSARADEPKTGGRFRQAVRGGSASNTLAGAMLDDTHAVNTSWQIRNNLTEVTPDGDAAGELAATWEASDNATRWVFKLRQGVEFHNGKTLDADDVVYSLNLHRGADAKSGGAGLVKGIADIKADGKDTVVFKLESGNADLPLILADYHFVIGIAGTRGNEWDRGIGTGPFILTDWQPGVRSATKRNPNYFKPGKPYFDEVETININDATARTTALQTGSADVMDTPDFKILPLLERDKHLKVRQVAGTKQYTFPMWIDTAPFDNNDVRLALKYAVDRPALLDTVLRGYGYLGNDQPIAKVQRFYNADLPQREYDPDKARFHLKKAGLANPAVTLSVGEIYPGAIDAAVLYKEQAKRAGITINIEQVAADGYWSNVWMKKPWCLSYWSGQVSADAMFTMAFAADSPWNETRWKNERFNQLLVQARAELDQAKRGDLYAEMQRMVRDEGGSVTALFASWVFVTSEAVQTPEKLAWNLVLDGNKNAERWWFS